MPPKGTRRASSSKASSRNSSSNLGDTTATQFTRFNSSAGSGMKQMKPLLSVSKPPIFAIPSVPIVKGKGKASKVQPACTGTSASPVTKDPDSEIYNGRLWVDEYEPQTEADLPVHKKKVETIRHWFQEAFEGGSTGNLRKYRKILVLTGPAGTAKTTTIRILSREMEFGIIEWSNSRDDAFLHDEFDDRESLTQKFGAFLTRAATCQPLASRSSTTTANSTSSSSRRVVLLEDLPNVLHSPTQEAFQSSIRSYVSTEAASPLVIIISDASTRGEVRDERFASGSRFGNRDVVDVRTVIPKDLLGGPYVSEINFNPIAPTLMHRALQALLIKNSLMATSGPYGRQLSKDELNIIVETSNGDIRSAVMALQFASIRNHSQKVGLGKSRNKGGLLDSRSLLEAVTRREEALHLFHLLGKVLYNKRKGDPPNPSASARDKQREKELDARLKRPHPLPDWLSDHKRRTSRVDVDMLYADSPIDTSLFSLYIHQNYTQFCDTVEECGDLCGWLSWIDSSGGEQWHQANPYQFHILTLGALHALPTPVPRRSQKLFKPAFFDILKKTRDAEDSASDVRMWMNEQCSSSVEACAAGWTANDVVLELGAVLKASSDSDNNNRPPPHTAFTALRFASSSGNNSGLLDDGEIEYGNDEVETFSSQLSYKRHGRTAQDGDSESGGRWLESDDIEDFDTT